MTIHVIGAGVAGLAAALALAEAGRPVVLHEAAPNAGGRCRALPDGTDNGTHALLGANTAALGLLARIGALEGWVEPEPAGLPVLDLRDGRAFRVALSPLGWGDPALRPPGLSGGALLALARLALPGRDRAVGPAHGRASRIPPRLRRSAGRRRAEHAERRGLRQPARRGAAALGRARRDAAAGGAQRPRPRPGRAGAGGASSGPAGRIRFGARLRRLVVQGGRVAGLDFGEDAVTLGPGDAAVLATPPWESQRLLPHLDTPGELRADRQPALRRIPATGPVRFIGMLDALCQWVLVRPAGVSVTVSAGDDAAREDQATLGPRAWAELRQAALAFGLAGDWPRGAAALPRGEGTPRHAAPHPGPAAAPAAPAAGEPGLGRRLDRPAAAGDDRGLGPQRGGGGAGAAAVVQAAAGRPHSDR